MAVNNKIRAIIILSGKHSPTLSKIFQMEIFKSYLKVFVKLLHESFEGRRSERVLTIKLSPVSYNFLFTSNLVKANLGVISRGTIK